MVDLSIPSRRDRSISSLVSAVTAIALFLLASIAVGAAGGAVFGSGGFPVWAAWSALLLSALVAWLGTARLGRGLIGDRAGSIQALGPDGLPATAGRTLLRAGVPVLVGVVGIVLGLGPTLVVLYVAAGLVAVLRADRRGPFEIVSGVRLTSLLPPPVDVVDEQHPSLGSE